MASADSPPVFECRIRALLDRVPLDANREVIKKYVRERRAGRITVATAFNDVNALMAYAQFLGTVEFRDSTKDHVIDYLSQAVRTRIFRNVRKDGTATITPANIPLGPRTIELRKTTLRSFYRWLMDDRDPPQFKGIKPGKKLPSKVVAANLIKPEDLRALLQAHPNARDKAILAFLAESGFRAGELCALNVGSVEFLGQFGHVTIPPEAPGLKTGPRRILVIDSLRYLHAWIEAHPRKDDRNAPLFYTMSHRSPWARMTGNGLWQFCINAGRRAGVRVKTHPHLFRHTSATEKACLGWNEPMMRDYFGWTKGSEMPSTYTHMTQQNFERIELARRGIAHGTAKPQAALTALICPACRTNNAITAIWCEQCRHPVSPGAAEDIRRQQLEALSKDMAALVRENVNQLLAQRGLTAV